MVRVGVLFWLCALLRATSAQQTLRLTAALSIDKDDDKVKTHAQISALLQHAKDSKFDQNVLRFLENSEQQLVKVLEAAKVVEEKKLTEIPKDFTPNKYRVKAMPKLQAKKNTAQKTTAKDLRKKLQDGKDVNFDKPLLITNATDLFESGAWDHLRRHWHAGRIMSDETLEKDLKIEYWQPEKARARLVGNMLQMEEPDIVSFSRYLTICFHGSPAKPKLPGQNTEHCEQQVNAENMANASELEDLNIFPEIPNALPMQAKFRRQLLEAAGDELNAILGKGADKWKKSKGQISSQFFTFGPSGSGDKLRAENGLPFMDVLIHGSRRWLLMTEEEMERVAAKAREALEFDKTSAYMFFEEKLPELKEEFGLKKYVEINQNAGDLVIVPSGWYRVSLALADSISYYSTMLSDKNILKAVTENSIWRPDYRQFQLAYCYDSDDLLKLPGMTKGSQLHTWLTEAIGKVKIDEVIPGILSNMLQCGSVLTLDKAMPKLDVGSLEACSPAIWKQCRKQLVAKLKKKGADVKLEWLPKEAPKSLDDLPALPAPVKGEEL